MAPKALSPTFHVERLTQHATDALTDNEAYVGPTPGTASDIAKPLTISPLSATGHATPRHATPRRAAPRAKKAI
jgi:hypothetical protein